MKLTPELWKKLAIYVKSVLFSKRDPSTLVPELTKLDLEDLHRKHRGFYIGLQDSSQKDTALVGFMDEGLDNLGDSVKKVVDALDSEINAKQISISSMQTSVFYFTIINNIEFINNGLAWNENEDGIYFNWGDKYKGMYLPYQIKNMNIKKTEIMNRLVSYEAKIPSNLWRLPEGMTWKLVCDSFQF